ncbi:hypothetical protein ACFO25_12745 [Paenactinomyces guangxiensis]|uniref:Glycerophosphoryl diester phosphodiesterase membrane domain-containing protein n=1 Tax=Paenactinomyces guangxiensis TaxID=1490290 RepID=A0A7W1WR98_9BACL|nr:hypothetical protein [Paenactinomyces guangxiensis]MBA4494601.1 hypothetical protein [Paenactinomyces guangxiensis]MBH8591636.1 hypothetical protein [Paenactinomyces guangxiensis]
MSYFGILKRHGLKLWVSNLLGYLATSTVTYILALILIAIYLVIVAAVAGSSIDGISETMSDTEAGMYFLEMLTSPGVLLPTLFFFLLFMIVIALTSAFQYAGAISVTVEAAEQNRSDIGTYFTRGFKYTGKMFVLMLLWFAAYLVPSIIGGISIPLFITEEVVGIIIGLLLLLISFILYILISIAFFHAPVILIVENTGATQAMTKSFYLLRKAFGRVFGSAFYTFLIYAGTITIFMIVVFILAFMLGLATASSPDAEGILAIFSVVINIVSIFVSWVFTPLLTVITLLLITIRYYKYLRSYINPYGNGGQPSFSYNTPNDDSSPSFSFKVDGQAGNTGQPTNDYSPYGHDKPSPDPDDKKNGNWSF